MNVLQSLVQSLWLNEEKVESGWALAGLAPLISGCGYSPFCARELAKLKVLQSLVQSLWLKLLKVESGWALAGLAPLISG